MIAKFVIGFDFTYKSPTEDAILVLRSDKAKYTVNTQDGYLKAYASDTAEWIPGDYLFQLLTSNGLAESGAITLLPNFALQPLSADFKTPAQQMVDAIEAVIEGRATQSQKSLTVGDKSLTYCDLSELLQYLDYFKKKVAEEQGQSSINDEHRVLYVWR